MSGTDALTASRTGGVISGQPCDLRTHWRNLFDQLLERALVLELRPTALWTGTEFDLKEIIDFFRLWSAGARMSALAPRSPGCHGAFLGVATERSRLAVRDALGLLERRFQLGNELCFDFQLLVQRSVFCPQALQFGRHLFQTLRLRERGLEQASRILAVPLLEQRGGDLHPQSRSLKSRQSA